MIDCSLYAWMGQPYDIKALVRQPGQCNDGRCECWRLGSITRHCPQCGQKYVGDGVQPCVDCRPGEEERRSER